MKIDWNRIQPIEAPKAPERVMVACWVCCKIEEYEGDPTEVDDDYKHYCGGSPQCCP